MSSVPQLRVVGADGFLVESPASPTPGGLSARMSLAEFFRAYCWPDLFAPAGDCQRTRREYEQSLAKWARHTEDPPLANITKRTCTQFVRGLAGERFRGGRALSGQTVKKHCGAIQRLLDRAGPEGRHNRGGSNVLDAVPWLAPPRARRPEPKSPLTLDEIWRWLNEARKAPATAKIAGCSPPVWWRAQILFAYNTALRSGCLMTVRWEMIRDRWLFIPGEIYKGGSWHMVWLNDPALDAIRSLPHRSGIIFPWEFTRDRGLPPPANPKEIWERTHQSYNTLRRKMQRRAGVRLQGLKALRQRFATECGKINVAAMQLQMGHSGSTLRMAREHYLDAEDILSSALQRLPQPAPAKQRMLF